MLKTDHFQVIITTIFQLVYLVDIYFQIWNTQNIRLDYLMEKSFFLSARWFWVIRVAQKLLETVSRFESITSGA